MQQKPYRDKLRRNLFNLICRFITILGIKLNKLRKTKWDKTENEVFKK